MARVRVRMACVAALMCVALGMGACAAGKVVESALPGPLYVPEPAAPTGDSDWDRRAHVARAFCEWYVAVAWRGVAWRGV